MEVHVTDFRLADHPEEKTQVRISILTVYAWDAPGRAAAEFVTKPGGAFAWIMLPVTFLF